ncbi:MAG: SoxR reducing system RseC family protein [Clostridia bacterium]|nr:SoxR reducing system RseC family protein [Clostridia bacterium]
MQQTGIVKDTRCAIKRADVKAYNSTDLSHPNTDEKLSAAEVEITRSSSCGENCASCGLCPGRTAKVYAINDINAEIGDTVIIDMADGKVLGAAFLVYIVPLIILIIGYFAGYAVFNSEALGIIIGFLFMAVAFIVIIRVDRKIRRKYTPHIVSIVNKGTEI